MLCKHNLSVERRKKNRVFAFTVGRCTTWIAGVLLMELLFGWFPFVVVGRGFFVIFVWFYFCVKEKQLSRVL